jgi:hypothetical protein
MQLKIRKLTATKFAYRLTWLLKLIPGAVTYFIIGHHTTCK